MKEGEIIKTYCGSYKKTNQTIQYDHQQFELETLVKDDKTLNQNPHGLLNLIFGKSLNVTVLKN